jgi:hypothetical protein
MHNDMELLVMKELLEEAVDLGLEPGEEAMAFAKAESPVRMQRLLAERSRSPQASPVRTMQVADYAVVPRASKHGRIG